MPCLRFVIAVFAHRKCRVYNFQLMAFGLTDMLYKRFKNVKTGAFLPYFCINIQNDRKIAVSVSAMLDIHVKKISLKFLFLSDIFLFPFVRQQFPILAYRCSWRQCCCFVDNIGYIFKEVNTLQSAGACKRIEHSCPFGTSMRPEEKRVSSG